MASCIPIIQHSGLTTNVAPIYFEAEALVEAGILCRKTTRRTHGRGVGGSALTAELSASVRQLSMSTRYHKPTLEEAAAILAESGAPIRSSEIVVPRQLIDDVIRCVAVIALSGTVLPPEMVDGKAVPMMGYTAEQHKACVQRCQNTLNTHNLWEWNASTKELEARRSIKRRKRHNSD